jgi:hypothetical protein
MFPLAVTGFGVALATVVMYFAWASQSIRQAKISEIIGPSNADGILVDTATGAVGTKIRLGQQVITQSGARVGLQETATSGVRLGSQSSLTLEKECIQLGDGQLIVSGTQGCVGAILIDGPQGIYTLERIGSLGEIKVLSGEVTISIPGNRSVQPISLKQNQKITIGLTGDEVGPVRLMLPMEIETILKGELFQGFQVALPEQSRIAGLPTSPIPESPSPQPSSSPAPAVRAAAPPPTIPLQPSYPDSGAVRPVYNGPEPEENDASSDDDVPPSPYSQYSRRRRIPDAGYDRYSYRRKVWRSPYAGGPYRRRSPVYSGPTYSDPPPAHGPVPNQEKPPAMAAPPPAAASPELDPLPVVVEEAPRPIPPPNNPATAPAPGGNGL